MKKIINDLMEKKAQEAIKKENEHIMRKARLSELEEKNKSMRHKLLHPIKSANDGKEIKKLKDDIAAFEKEKEDKGILLVAVGILCVLMIMLFATSLFGKSSNNKADETPVAMTVSEAKTETVAEAKTEKPIESTKEVPAVIEEEQASVDSSTGYTGEETDDSEEKGNEIVNETTEQETEEIDADDEPIEQGLLVSDLAVFSKPDYIHKNGSSNSIYLGNDEGVTFTIETGKEVNDIEEFIFDYDTSLLNLTVRDFDYEDGKTTIILYVTALKECDAEFIITTEYEVNERDEEAECYPISIEKLNSSEGKVVYVTEYGEKYHYSAACAGENAIKTTRYDAEMWEYGPCGKCVN